MHRTQEYQQGQQFILHCMSLTIQLALHVPKPPPAIPSTPLPPSARGPQVRVSPALPAVPADGDGERLHAGERVEARERQAAAEGRRRDAGLNTCLDSGEKDKQILLYDNTICRDRDTLCSQDLCLKLVSNEHEEHFLYRDSLPHSYTYCLPQALDDSPSNFTSARPPSVCTPNRIYTFEAAHHWKPGLKGEQTCTHTNQCINPLSCINMRIALSETRTRAQAQLRVARGEPEAGARARSQRCARPMEDSAQIASKTVMHTTKAMPHAARRSRYPGAAMFPVLRSVDGLCQGRRRDRRRQATSKPHQPTSLHHAQGSHNKRCHPARCCRADATLHARCSALVGTQSGTHTTRSSNSARTWNAPRQEDKRAPEYL